MRLPSQFRSLTLVFFLVSLGLLTARAYAEQVALQKGLEAYQGRDFNKAIQHLLPIVAAGETASGYREAVAALGMSYYLINDFQQASGLLEEASAGAPDNVELAYALAVSHLRQRNADRARRAFARMFQLPADSAQARLITAKFMMRENMENLAQLELERAAQQDPNLPQVYHQLGALAIFRGEFDQAISFLQKEIAINPGFWMAHYRLGDAYTRKELWDVAVAPLQKAIWLNPDFTSPYILLGKVYHKMGRFDLAAGLLERALSMDPNNEQGHYLLARTYQRLGRQKAARQQFEIVRKLKASAASELGPHTSRSIE